MAVFSLSSPGVYVEIVGACGGVAGGAGGGSDGIGICGGGAVGAHAHSISDPGHTHGFGSGGGGCMGDVAHLGPNHGLEELMQAMTKAIAQSMTMPPMEFEPPANYLACENAFVVRDIDQRFSWQDE